jgi:hypothetical protein
MGHTTQILNGVTKNVAPMCINNNIAWRCCLSNRSHHHWCVWSVFAAPIHICIFFIILFYFFYIYVPNNICM